MKKMVFAVLLAAGAAAALFAAQLVSEEQAVKDMLPGGGVEMSIKISEAQLKTITDKIGADAAKGVSAGKEEKCYKGSEGIAVIVHQDGKWGDIEMIVLVKAGKVINLSVLASSEKRGRPIVMRTFLDQYKGKALADNMTIGRNIDAVTGATISSQAVTDMVKRALAISEIAAGSQAPAAEKPKAKTKKKK